MKKINIALVSINGGANIETFVNLHKKHLQGNVHFYYGTPIPTLMNNGDVLISKKQLFKNRFFRLINIKSKFTLEEATLIESFKNNDIKAVYAEFGITGANLVPICKELKIPIITSFLGFEISMNIVIEKYLIMYKKLFDYGASFIIVSKHMEEKLLNWACPKGKIVWSPYPPSEFNFKAKCMFNSNTFFMMGRFVDKKAPYYSILAFSKVLQSYPHSILNIAGNGPLLETCKNLVSYLKINESVNFLGALKHEETVNYIENALCFIQHSITSISGDQEGTPVAILEASASGLPVIATKHAGIVDVVINNKTGFLVEEHNVEEMSEKMIYLLENKDIAKKMGEEGRKFVYENFRLEKHIECVNAVIKDAINYK